MKPLKHYEDTANSGNNMHCPKAGRYNFDENGINFNASSCLIRQLDVEGGCYKFKCAAGLAIVEREKLTHLLPEPKKPQTQQKQFASEKIRKRLAESNRLITNRKQSAVIAECLKSLSMAQIASLSDLTAGLIQRVLDGKRNLDLAQSRRLGKLLKKLDK